VEIFPQREQGKSRDQAAALFGTNGRYVQDMKSIGEQDQALLDDVFQGAFSVPDAKTLAKLPTGKRERVKNISPRAWGDTGLGSPGSYFARLGISLFRVSIIMARAS
jgi:hypothetical protein